MVCSRLFQQSDASKVASLVHKTLTISNTADYSQVYIDDLISHMDTDFFIEKAKQTHFYVFFAEETLVGTGAIGAFWGSETEYCLFDLFVDPDYQDQGFGRYIISTLEQDEYFKKARRIEIPASITAVNFYLKMGYDFKNNAKQLDHERLYRLEKFPQ